MEERSRGKTMEDAVEAIRDGLDKKIATRKLEKGEGFCKDYPSCRVTISICKNVASTDRFSYGYRRIVFPEPERKPADFENVNIV